MIFGLRYINSGICYSLKLSSILSPALYHVDCFAYISRPERILVKHSLRSFTFHVKSWAFTSFRYFLTFLGLYCRNFSLVASILVRIRSQTSRKRSGNQKYWFFGVVIEISWIEEFINSIFERNIPMFSNVLLPGTQCILTVQGRARSLRLVMFPRVNAFYRYGSTVHPATPAPLCFRPSSLASEGSQMGR